MDCITAFIRLSGSSLVNLFEFVSCDIDIGDPVIVGGESVSRVSGVKMLDQDDEMLEDEDESGLELGLGQLHLLHPRKTRFVQNVTVVFVDLIKREDRL